MPVIGFLNGGSPEGLAPSVAGFRQGLAEAGYVDGRNVAIEFHWADGQYERQPAMAAALVQRRMTVIAANSTGAVAAKALTTTIPIVFTTGTDPVQLGLVASLNRPGGNVTGVFQLAGMLGSKRLELLRELVPGAGSVAILLNPRYTNTPEQLSDLQMAARLLGQQVHAVYASNEAEIDAAFATLAQVRPGALLVGTDSLFSTSRRDQLVALAARHRIAAMYEYRDFAAAGGLMSYGASLVDSYRQAGVYVGRILKGTRPADLPVLQPTRFEFVINLKTAKALGLDVPPKLLALTDEVIE
jgi:putative ABC transport system substrate-binding protein